MKLSEYLLDRIFSLICMLVAALVLLALLWLIETPAVFILFAEVILLAAYSTALLYDFFRKQSFYNLLQKMTEQMDIKTLLGELMVPPHFLEGQILVDVLRCCNKYQNDRLSYAEQENREYREYLDSWVHEIKTPITSARLIVENEKNPTTLRIDDELRKIDAYVEQVLYYARSTDVEKDFKVEKTTLQALVYAALKTYSKPLIQVGGKPVLKELDAPSRNGRSRTSGRTSLPAFRSPASGRSHTPACSGLDQPSARRLRTAACGSAPDRRSHRCRVASFLQTSVS